MEILMLIFVPMDSLGGVVLKSKTTLLHDKIPLRC